MAGEITKEQLWEMMQRGEDFKLVDALSREQYEEKHIKGALSMPSSEILQKAKSMLEKDDTIVVYCANRQCKASQVAVQKLESMGYENVSHYPGGIEEWSSAGMPVEEGAPKSGAAQ